MKKFIYFAVLAVVVSALAFSSCKKEAEEPTATETPVFEEAE